MISMIQRLTRADGTAVETADETGAETVEGGAADEETLPVPTGHDDLKLARRLVGDQLDRAEDRFEDAWEVQGDLAASQEALTERHGWRTALAAIEQHRSERSESETLQVHVDGRAVQEAYATVFADPGVETLVYLSGLHLGDRVTLNRVVEVPHRAQTAVSAEGEPEAQFEVLQELDKQGFQLLGHLHNHPGEGVSATEPSQTDLSYQKSLEDLGYSAVGFVATEDGVLRAYSADLEFDIAVHGDGIEELTTHDRQQYTFRLRGV